MKHPLMVLMGNLKCLNPVEMSMIILLGKTVIFNTNMLALKYSSASRKVIFKTIIVIKNKDICPPINGSNAGKCNQ